MVNAQQGCIYLTKIQYKKTVILYILLQFEMFIPIVKYFKITFIPVLAKLDFQQPFLQFSVSHDPSEIILIC